MASTDGPTDRNEIVADVATRLFGTSIARDAIITETLKRATDPSRSADQGLTQLGEAIDRAVSGKAYDGRRSY